MALHFWATMIGNGNSLQGTPNAMRQTASIMDESSFVELIGRLQSNHRDAIELLIERYGRALRRAIERALFERRLAVGPGGPDRTRGFGHLPDRLTRIPGSP